ncbi:MAG: nucleotidyltransferase family protein [Ilumatobacteraceae bacterium]
MRVTAALLAAGGGTRFRDAASNRPHKLLAVLDDRPVWRHSLGNLLDAGFEHVVVVTGRAPIDDDVAAIGAPAITVAHNAGWATGQASSLQLAVDAARVNGSEAVVVGLADQPFVTADAWRAVADAPPTCSLVVATYDGQWGPNPVRIAAEHWSALPTSGDEGARTLLRTSRERVCTVACVGSPADIDTPEDLARWTSS